MAVFTPPWEMNLYDWLAPRTPITPPELSNYDPSRLAFDALSREATRPPTYPPVQQSGLDTVNWQGAQLANAIRTQNPEAVPQQAAPSTALGSTTNPEMLTLDKPKPSLTQRLFGDRNFQSLLAGIGAGIDPEGVGGALGRATVNYNSSVARQELAKELAKKRSLSDSDARMRAWRMSMMDYFGNPTPSEQEGLNKVTFDANGATAKFDAPPESRPGGTEQIGGLEGEPSYTAAAAPQSGTLTNPRMPRMDLQQF